MPANSYNRKTARQAVAALFEAALVGTGKPCEAFYRYRVGDFAGKSPVGVLMSSGSKRPKISVGVSALREITLYFDLYIFVAYADQSTGWTDENSEDKLDDVEKLVAEVVADHERNSGNWEALTMGDRSETAEIVSVFGGMSYRREVFPLEMRLILR